MITSEMGVRLLWLHAQPEQLFLQRLVLTRQAAGFGGLQLQGQVQHPQHVGADRDRLFLIGDGKL